MDDIISKAYTLGVRFLRIASEYVHGLDLQQVSAKTIVRRFKALVGISPIHCGLLWLFIEDHTYKMNSMREMKHLLWTLNLLWCDSTENMLQSCWRADEKTIRKYVNIFLEALATVDVVCIVSLLIVLMCWLVSNMSLDSLGVSKRWWLDVEHFCFCGWNRLPYQRATPFPQELVFRQVQRSCGEV